MTTTLHPQEDKLRAGRFHIGGLRPWLKLCGCHVNGNQLVCNIAQSSNDFLDTTSSTEVITFWAGHLEITEAKLRSFLQEIAS